MLFFFFFHYQSLFPEDPERRKKFEMLEADLNRLKEFPQVTLGSLFQITTGVLDDGGNCYYVNEKNEKLPAKMLRMGSFNLLEKRLKDPDDLIVAEKHLKKIRKTKKVDRQEKIVLQEKVLSADDYVICTRGIGELPFVGISLQNSPLAVKTDGDSYIISHHFIVLKPREGTPHQLHIPFMHLLLDALLETKLVPEMKEEEKQSSLTKRFLERCRIAFPPEQEQIQIYQNYQNLFAEFKTLEGEIQKVKGILAGKEL